MRKKNTFPKSDVEQLSILSDINGDNYKKPVETSKILKPSLKQIAPAVRTKQGQPIARQTFLPGLSRRGRPRLAKPISAVDRTAEHRRKRIDQGSKRVEVILAPEVKLALDALVQHSNSNKSAVISKLLLKASAALKSRDPGKTA